MTLDGLMALMIGYLLGSVPVGYLVVRLRTGGDLRRAGSGSTGATNASRVLGRSGFALVFAFDFAKGILAVLVATWVAGASWALAGAGAAAVAGHVWPIWLGFRGGRGLATGFGAAAVISPVTTGIALLTMIALLPFLRPRLIPLVVAVALAPFVALLVDRSAAPGVGIIAVLILAGHRTNIRAALAGGIARGRGGVG